MNKIYIILLSILSVACTEKITLKTDDADPVMVIFGCISDMKDLQQVEVRSSAPYFSAEPNISITDASVEIVSSDGEVWPLKYVDNGVYQTVDSVAGIQGMTYTLNVLYDFDKDGSVNKYTAETTIPSNITVDSAYLCEDVLMNNHYYLLYISAQDNKGDDFYLYHIYVNDTLRTQKLSMWSTFNDASFDGQYMDADIYELADLNEIDDYDEDVVDDWIFVKPGDVIRLDFGKTDEGFYDFINQAQSEREGESPFFSGPASNICTNLSGGAVGYFGSRSVTKKYMIAGEKE